MNQGQQPHVFGCQPCIQSLLGKGNIRKMTETEEKNEMTSLSPSDKKKKKGYRVSGAERKAYSCHPRALFLREVISCTCMGDPAGRFQAFRLPNLHCCTPTWISGCYSRPNFSNYWEWLCVKKLLDISRLAWVCRRVDGGTLEYAASAVRMEGWNSKHLEQNQFLKEEATRGYWGVLHVSSVVYGGISLSLGFCLNPFANTWLFSNIYDDHVGFSCGSVAKNLPANAGDLGSIPGSGAWRAAVRGVTKSQTRRK